MPLTLDDLRGGEGSRTNRKRVGRGHGSGKGKTAGRGTKGQKARSGPGVGRGFEGGQLPIQQRLPYKRGFTNIYRTPWATVNLGRLEALGIEGPITPELLVARRVTRGPEFPVKVLGGGELTKPLTVHAHAFTESAKSAIEQLGGTVILLERTDDWVQARPRSRRIPINRELKRMRVGKVGGPSRREALAALAAKQES
ncbi:MAG: ribosomal protein [Thermomicrobiales bacterium]|jgi:large subunit ribosomal protein L15|nr:ribosomal protein [Thermomicrobiales bacterium]MDF3037348.1 ribosomal protein [Thermomicrobiales bacterium]